MNDDMPHGHKPAKKGFAFAHFAFLVALGAALFLLGAMMATHLGYITMDMGFKTLTLGYGPKIAQAALIISGLSLLISVFMDVRRCGPWALAAVVISAALVGGFYAYEKISKQYPPIADVATNWERPLTFSDKLIEARGPDALAVEDMPRVAPHTTMEWGGKSIPQINAMTCPGARTILHRHIGEDQVAAMLRAEKYVVFGTAPWRVEATYQDSFYGFQSDVVVRIEPNGIDVRSVSRYDMPDFGANCRRVMEIIRKLNALPDEPAASDKVAPPPAQPAPSPQDSKDDAAE